MGSFRVSPSLHQVGMPLYRSRRVGSWVSREIAFGCSTKESLWPYPLSHASSFPSHVHPELCAERKSEMVEKGKKISELSPSHNAIGTI